MIHAIKNCTGVILAGGENLRMPMVKSFIEIHGEKIIERNLKIMRQLFKEIFIVTNEPGSYIYLNTPLLGDVYNVRGPLTGIFTSLLNSSHNWVFIAACDMPFINKDLIPYMASKRDNCDAVVPRYDKIQLSQQNVTDNDNPPRSPFTKGGSRGIITKRERRGNYTEPLFAFYSKRLLSSMEKAILSDKRGMKDFLEDKRVKYINTDEIRKIDVNAESFINLNTPRDLERYMKGRRATTMNASNSTKRGRQCLDLE